ncbi:MAG: asparagine synthase (glutamine-hydrolyzing) [Deltaproteobacteria bacterium]|nr:asparagine synthase (glutamine-hydrolyzing) [Deltaproteobacteria bacterium]
MCGIAGRYNFRTGRPVEAATLRKMASSISHRGPDDEGVFTSGPLGLAFRRLSIIDLSGGHQPMSDEGGRVWVAFNGEIYNFPELRKELESKGYAFRTRSDTEVIVNGYREWGADVLKLLNGMFGLAIWDERDKRLVLGRDRMGIKPVYYRCDADGVAFGSEVKALLSEGHRPEPDEMAMYLFLRYRYTPSPLTIFKGIKKLAPGTRLVVEAGKEKVERWWKETPSPFDPMPDEREAVEGLLSVYRRAVKRHLLSDVEIGVLLSGGVDSGVLLALMKELGGPWRTYTAGFGIDFRDDELMKGRVTAIALGARNQPVELRETDFDDTLTRLVPILEEPVAASSIVPMYHLCKRVRQDVKAAVMGQGPDELFGGYKRHLGVHYGKYWRSIPAWARSLSAAGLSCLPRNETIRRGLFSLGSDDRFERYERVFSVVDDGTARALFRDGVLPEGAESALFDCWSGLLSLMPPDGELNGLEFLEVRSSLPDELLLYADKLSMAHGLEIRVPYLDNEVVDFAERLSPRLKIRNGKGKWVHREAARRLLPESIVSRKKLGFATPIDKWFRDIKGPLAERLTGVDSKIYRYLERDTVLSMLNDHRSGRSDNSKTLFSIAVLEEWLRAYAA